MTKPSVELILSEQGNEGPSVIWLNLKPTSSPAQTVPLFQNQDLAPRKPIVAQGRPTVQNVMPVQVTDNANPERFGGPDYECGNPDYREPTTTGLIVGGRVAIRGQFPW